LRPLGSTDTQNIARHGLGEAPGSIPEPSVRADICEVSTGLGVSDRCRVGVPSYRTRLSLTIDIAATVLAFLKAWECNQLDRGSADHTVEFTAQDARYHVFPTHDPFVGRDAIRAELLRQAPLLSDIRFEILNVASTGNTVFVQRRDCVTMFGKAAKFHVVGVFEFDASGKIVNWRDYLDSAEIAAKVGQDAPQGTFAVTAPRLLEQKEG
jgi:limonene-1,2-epoxide hydrolase